MDILYFLIPLSLVVFGVIIWAIFWTVKHGQYDDLEGPAHRILMDDDDPRIPGREPAGKSVRGTGKEQGNPLQ
ncbi:MAG: cbb3-type cytochrome oxidase assembly protein CcoS [Halothiobacillaceae bacterium]|nr:cbb3-type cytochrome oxidase assembly protein CcoS [Halothiobacillaceae bacterium]